MTLSNSGTDFEQVGYQYDVLGRKVARQVAQINAGTPTQESLTGYVNDGANIQFEIDLTDSGRITSHYFYGPGVNEAVAIDRAGTTVWNFADALGTVRSVGLLDGGEWKLVHRNLDQFGNLLPFRLDDGSIEALLGDTNFGLLGNAPLIFAGHQFDDEIGLYDAQARLLDASIGRFLTQDPARSDGNLYRYAANDPNNLIDPDGQIVVTASIALAFGAAAFFSFDAAANRYDAATDLFGLANPTAGQVAEANDLLASAQSFEIGGRVLGTVAFAAALAPVAAPLYNFTTTAVAAGGGGTALQFVAGATAVGVTDKVLLDTIAFSSGIDPEAFTRFTNNPGFTALDFGISIASAGLFNGGTDVARLLSGGLQGSARSAAFRAFARSGLVNGPVPSGVLRSLDDLASDTVTVFRVEGSANTRVLIGNDGSVGIIGNQTLFLNFGSRSRAQEFLARRLAQGFAGTVARRFEVPQSFLDDLRAAAITEAELFANPGLRGRPLRVDITRAPDQFGLRPAQIEELRQDIIQGSGRQGL